jgi:hypothetical protein
MSLPFRELPCVEVREDRAVPHAREPAACGAGSLPTRPGLRPHHSVTAGETAEVVHAVQVVVQANVADVELGPFRERVHVADLPELRAIVTREARQGDRTHDAARANLGTARHRTSCGALRSPGFPLSPTTAKRSSTP